MKVETLKMFYEIVVQNDSFDPKKIEYRVIRLIEGVSKLSNIFLTEANFTNKNYDKQEFIVGLMEIEYLSLNIYKILNDRNITAFNFNALIENLGNKIRFLREEYNSKQNKLNINFIYMKMIKTVGDLSNTFTNRDNKGDDKIRFDCITNLLTYVSFLLDLSVALFKEKYSDIREFEKYYSELFMKYSEEYKNEVQNCKFNIERIKDNLEAKLALEKAKEEKEGDSDQNNMMVM